MDGVVNMRMLSALASFDGKVRYADAGGSPSVQVQGNAGLHDVYVQTVHRTGTAEKTTMEAGEDLMEPSARLLREAGVPFETAVVQGDPAQSMLDLIEEHRCDMVVMGSRALGPVRRWLEGGSTSQRLVQSSPVPVLLVTPPASDET